MDVTNPTTALLEMKNAYGSVTGGLDPTAIAATSGLYVTSECTDASELQSTFSRAFLYL